MALTYATRRARSVSSRSGASVGELLGLRSAASGGCAYLEPAREAQPVTYGELGRIAARWAERLEDVDLARGETVGVCMSDPLAQAVVFLAVLAAERTVAPLDPSGTDAELAAACVRVTPRLVVADRPAPPGAPVWWVTKPSRAWLVEGPTRAARPARRPTRPARRPTQPTQPTHPTHPTQPTHPTHPTEPTHPTQPTRPTRPTRPEPAAGRPAGAGGVVLSTSGTTGQAKVIRLEEPQLLHAASSIAQHFELSPDDRGFNALPLAHINAQVVGLLATLVSGATIVLDDRFHRRGFWATMARRRITWVNAVPAILARLAMLEEGEVVPDGIRFARSASAPLAVPVLERFERATGIPVVETYGMTEAASQITANPLHGPRKPGSVGLPVGTEVRVVPGGGDTGDAAAAPGEVGRVQGSHRDDLRAVPDTVAAPGEVGRVLVRGPSVIRAYVSPGYEDRIDADGWLDTGDLGYRDGAGFLFLVGRADDVINRGGEKVYPLEVESVVLGDPQVTSVAVAGRDDEALGRVPVAYLVVDGVGGPDDERLAAAVAARVHRRCTRLLSRPKRPVAYHVVDRLPQGATGKVRRGALAGATPLFSLLVS